MPQRRGRAEGSIRQRRRADGSVFWETRVSIDSKQRSFYDDTKTGAAAKARAAKVDSERGVVRPLQSVMHAPAEVDHRFRTMSIRDSGGCRSRIPGQGSQFWSRPGMSDRHGPESAGWP